MRKILHCADLHLTAEAGEKNYSLIVLDEIVSLALKNKVGFFILAGDTFNSFSDAESLRREFKDRMRRFEGNCTVLLLPGNHEDINRNKRKLTSYDLGIPPEDILEKGEEPFIFKRFEGVEFIAIPHQKDYRNYHEWPVPEKQEKFRIAIAHGYVVPDVVFIGITDEEEETAPVIDLDLFLRHSIDYAAMGHIHAGIEKQIKGLTINYPGSARVWRSSNREKGPRKVNLLELGSAVEVTPLEIAAAGQYRSSDLFVRFDGTIGDLSEEASNWERNDLVRLNLFGVVENENVVTEKVKSLEKKYSSAVRKFQVNRNIHVLEGISSQPIVRKFLEIWESMVPKEGGDDQLRIWNRARELGLLKIKEIMDN